ncbi:hypothetical protein SSBR45G_10980 [Bradyrhizobium sp. SSBR45G]|uniref:hypothetical protein n=1 Tax=unclassified Bradyrhizobium TaxID=2631580 RepID=UPI0023428E64|nr:MULTISPECIES: hypothetical protein [unclassified Bradyrhizobium]GLH76190.1 hypothetical protein SSBR45G_10980 [Bradyrhizobium sp. SSBR45G]GLH83326.1 hypothetical protein SSBR45R_07860 [Bradyrhizobium sp. SSBR45R]
MRALAHFTLVIVLLGVVPSAQAMDFRWRDQSTVQASGPIGQGDAAKLAALAKFDTLELDSPGGLVSEALAMAANIDARGNIQTVVASGASCASACAMAIFVSGQTRIVRMGGRLGIHSCASSDGTQSAECNTAMAANARAHGVPWGVIEGFGKYTKPSSMLWLTAEDAECWGLMKWSLQDTSNNGIACFRRGLSMKPAEVTAKNADDVLCRMNAGTSGVYVSTGRKGQGFSDAYREACRRIAADPRTPKYAAIDIILWLTLTDPNVSALKPGTLMVTILEKNESQIRRCWKCLTIVGISMLMRGQAKDALSALQEAVEVVKQETGAVPAWLPSRVELAEAEAKKSP